MFYYFKLITRKQIIDLKKVYRNKNNKTVSSVFNFVYAFYARISLHYRRVKSLVTTNLS